MFPQLRRMPALDYDGSRLESIIDLNKRNQFFPINESTFSPELMGRLKSMTRKDNSPILFGIGRTRRVIGLAEGLYKLPYELRQLPSEGVDTKTQPISVGVFNTDLYSNYLIILPLSRGERNLVSLFNQDSNGLTQPQAREIMTGIQNHKEYARNLTAVFDPDQIQTFNLLSLFPHKTVMNTVDIMQYFATMSNLVLNGTFGDTVGMVSVAGVKGVLPDNKLGYLGYKESSDFQYVIELPSLLQDIPLGNDALLQSFFTKSGEWYKSSDFKKPLDVHHVFANLSEIGLNAFMRENDGDSPANYVVASSVQRFVSELYKSYTGLDSINPAEDKSNFYERLQFIDTLPSFNGTLKPFIDICGAKDKISPSQYRNSGAHERGLSTYQSHEHPINTWAALYYRDLSKTILSTLVGEPQQYFSFDAFARDSNLIGSGKNSVAHVPISVSQSFKL